MKVILLWVLMFNVQQSFSANKVSFEKMFSTCLQRDWDQTSCQFRKDKDYQPSLGSQYVGNNVFKLPRMINQFQEDLKRLNGSLQTCSNSSESKVNLMNLTSMLQHAVKNRKLSQCKAACMAMCVSSTIVEYDVSKSDFQTPCRILEEQKGGCAEFATFSVYFARQLGIDADIAYTALPSPHNFSKVRLDNKDYYMEPQRSGCDFYEAE